MANDDPGCLSSLLNLSRFQEAKAAAGSQAFIKTSSAHGMHCIVMSLDGAPLLPRKTAEFVAI
jgi:hypothetical protein